MRLAISVLCGLFLTTVLGGCGAGTTSTKPPEGLTPGPPPGTSPDAGKVIPKK
jgi:hypothetical protein